VEVFVEAYASWAGIFLCLSQSAMLSGLNLACFSISRIQLEIEAAQDKEDAIKVLGLRKDANFLLTTILWGNVGVNTLLALLSGSVLGGIAAFLFSTVFITVFAEIFPQAYFSRNALKVASLLSPVVRFYQFLLYPVAKPTAKILDLWLGPEGIHYVREEMLKRYLLRSIGMSGSEISAFEGKGAVNFLALDSRQVGDEGSILAPRSVVRVTAVDGRLELPTPGTPGWKAFVAQVQASEERWVVLTDSTDAPRLLLDANRFLRAAFSSSESDLDPRDHCVEPVVTTNPNDTLEKVLGNAKVPENDSTERGIILLWDKQRRIITHFDVLKRLFQGVLPPTP
jgi:metal transporter CNNM